MRWKGREESDNVEDRRRASPGGLAVGGGLGTLVLLIIALLAGVDPQQLLQQMPANNPVQVGQGGGQRPQDDELAQFVKVVLRDTEVVWSQLLREQGKEYREPKLVLFSGNVESACGYASAAVGPFYCPADQKVYLDLSFYQELKSRFGAPGDFAQAYVIAHEIGHHVQNLLGISNKVHSLQRGMGKAEANELSVRQELQADFFAGVWAHHAQKKFRFLEEGDIEEALRCAKAIGDDNLQMKSKGYVVPDSFTHGSSEQRMRWFKLGFVTGDLSKGDTFSADQL